MQLTFVSVSPMLTLRVVLVSQNFVRSENPIFYLISPNCNPDKHITTFWFYLLKVHIKGALAINSEGFYVKRLVRFFKVNGPGRFNLYFYEVLFRFVCPPQNQIIFT
jgi:hypothetical protein